MAEYRNKRSSNGYKIRRPTTRVRYYPIPWAVDPWPGDRIAVWYNGKEDRQYVWAEVELVTIRGDWIWDLWRWFELNVLRLPAGPFLMMRVTRNVPVEHDEAFASRVAELLADSVREEAQLARMERRRLARQAAEDCS